MAIINAKTCFGNYVRWESYGLPCPSVGAFSYEVGAGLIRTPFESGHTRQRRRWTNRPTTYALTWKVNTSQLGALEAFIQELGYDWFYIPVITGQVGRWNPADHLIRFTTNWSVNLEAEDLWTLTVSAEQYEIDPECLLELQCDDIQECLQKIAFPLVTPPYFLPLVQILPADFGVWANPNG